MYILYIHLYIIYRTIYWKIQQPLVHELHDSFSDFIKPSRKPFVKHFEKHFRITHVPFDSISATTAESSLRHCCASPRWCRSSLGCLSSPLATIITRASIINETTSPWCHSPDVITWMSSLATMGVKNIEMPSSQPTSQPASQAGRQESRQAGWQEGRQGGRRAGS